jgi:hypothetical protein
MVWAHRNVVRRWEGIRTRVKFMVSLLCSELGDFAFNQSQESGVACPRNHATLRSNTPSYAGGVDISSKGNADFAELAAVPQIPVHSHHLVEPECAIDDRLERATREALGDVLHRDLPAFRVARTSRMLYPLIVGIFPISPARGSLCHPRSARRRCRRCPERTARRSAWGSPARRRDRRPRARHCRS